MLNIYVIDVINNFFGLEFHGFHFF